MITLTIMMLFESEAAASNFGWVGTAIGAIVLAIVTFFLTRRKYNAETSKTEAEIGEKFVALVDKFYAAKNEAISAEEKHSLERIASNRELSDLREQVENCESEHIAWNTCKMQMLEFLIGVEPELQLITSQPTLLLSVQTLKKQIERS